MGDTVFYLRIISISLVLVAIFLFFFYSAKNNVVRATSEKVRKKFNERAENKHREDIARILGNESEEKKGFEKIIASSSERFYYAFLDQRLKGMTPEMWLTIKVAICVSALILSGLIFHKFFWSLITCFMCAVVLYLAELRMASKNYKAVDAQLSQFVNMVGNFAETEGKITGVLSRVAPYMDDPLYTRLMECYNMAQLNGDEHMALTFLLKRVEHPRFKELIRNLIACSDYTADFSKIVEGGRRILAQEQKAKRERKAMTREATINMVIISLLLVVTWVISNSIIEDSIWRIIVETPVGNFCIIGIFIIYLIFGIRIVKEAR